MIIIYANVWFYAAILNNHPNKGLYQSIKNLSTRELHYVIRDNLMAQTSAVCLCENPFHQKLWSKFRQNAVKMWLSMLRPEHYCSCDQTVIGHVTRPLYLCFWNYSLLDLVYNDFCSCSLRCGYKGANVSDWHSFQSFHLTIGDIVIMKAISA